MINLKQFGVRGIGKCNDNWCSLDRPPIKVTATEDIAPCTCEYFEREPQRHRKTSSQEDARESGSRRGNMSFMIADILGLSVRREDATRASPTDCESEVGGSSLADSCQKQAARQTAVQ